MPIGGGQTVRWGVAPWIWLLLLAVSLAPAEPAKSPKSQTRAQSIAAGKALFMEHCASCHGDDAKGAGPGAVSLKVQPPDLTALAKRNHGKFPDEEVYRAIHGDQATAAHGSREMPAWGPAFLAISNVDQADAERRIRNLVVYIKSIQVK
jgi:mono/diheme cytochrome c family protein